MYEEKKKLAHFRIKRYAFEKQVPILKGIKANVPVKVRVQRLN